jgi:hypothetical protein
MPTREDRATSRPSDCPLCRDFQIGSDALSNRRPDGRFNDGKGLDEGISTVNTDTRRNDRPFVVEQRSVSANQVHVKLQHFIPFSIKAEP